MGAVDAVTLFVVILLLLIIAGLLYFNQRTYAKQLAAPPEQPAPVVIDVRRCVADPVVPATFSYSQSRSDQLQIELLTDRSDQTYYGYLTSGSVELQAISTTSLLLFDQVVPGTTYQLSIVAENLCGSTARTIIGSVTTCSINLTLPPQTVVATRVYTFETDANNNTIITCNLSFDFIPIADPSVKYSISVYRTDGLRIYQVAATIKSFVATGFGPQTIHVSFPSYPNNSVITVSIIPRNSCAIGAPLLKQFAIDFNPGSPSIPYYGIPPLPATLYSS